jgi:hypothetical protein
VLATQPTAFDPATDRWLGDSERMELIGSDDAMSSRNKLCNVEFLSNSRRNLALPGLVRLLDAAMWEATGHRAEWSRGPL